MTCPCTVAIPVHNRVDLIGRCVASALAQDVPGLRVLVVDNHSTDGTWEALQAFSDPRLRVVRNPRNLGLFGNFNRCIDLAEGEWLKFLCSDDLLVAGALGRELASVAARPQVALLTSRGEYVDLAGRPRGRVGWLVPPGTYPGRAAIGESLAMLLRLALNPFNYPSGVLVRRSALAAAGGFDPGMRIVSDVDLFLRVLAHGDLAVSADVATLITLHPGQISARERSGSSFVFLREYLALQRRNRAGAAGPRAGSAWSSGVYAALSLWYAARHLVKGPWRGARAHLRFACAVRAPATRKLAALLAFLLLRLRYLLAERRVVARAWDWHLPSRAQGGAPR
jgi:glycosyltransferase involved in cell wall biosynthesis